MWRRRLLAIVGSAKEVLPGLYSRETRTMKRLENGIEVNGKVPMMGPNTEKEEIFGCNWTDQFTGLAEQRSRRKAAQYEYEFKLAAKHAEEL